MSNFTKIVSSKVKESIQRNEMLRGISSVVVGFSGGADSVCLLHILNSLKGEFSFSLEAVHINHGIRGSEAERDSLFAEEFCKAHHIPFHLYEFDCIGLSEELKLSLEECGRKVRYDIFQKFCGEGKRVATAHNANDNAETVLFNLSRGTGIKGVCGIPSVRGDIIRPLISCTRDEIEGYCKENNLGFVTDSTNLSDEYTRNKIRHKVIPELASLNSGAIDNINNFSAIASDIDDYLSIQVEKSLADARVGDNSYKCSMLSNLHDAVLDRCILIAFSEFSDISLSREKIKSISRVLRCGGRIQLYGDIYAESVKDVFRFFENKATKTDDILFVDDFSDEILFNGCKIQFSRMEEYSEIVNKNLLDNLIDCDKIVGKLFIRCRKEGDTFRYRKRTGTKTLKKVFNEMNIPVEKRETLPLLCDDEGIVWIYSVGVCSRCSVTENSRNIVFVRGEDNDR